MYLLSLYLEHERLIEMLMTMQAMTMKAQGTRPWQAEGDTTSDIKPHE